MQIGWKFTVRNFHCAPLLPGGKYENWLPDTHKMLKTKEKHFLADLSRSIRGWPHTRAIHSKVVKFYGYNSIVQLSFKKTRMQMKAVTLEQHADHLNWNMSDSLDALLEQQHSSRIRKSSGRTRRICPFIFNTINWKCGLIWITLFSPPFWWKCCSSISIEMGFQVAKLVFRRWTISH